MGRVVKTNLLPVCGGIASDKRCLTLEIRKYEKLKKLLYIVPLLGLMATACTDIESIEIDHIGGNNTKDDVESEAYYADLRAYKETAKNYGRPVAFGWFSNWAPTGAMRRGYLTSVPDSMDIISMWSGAPGRYEITEAQKKDKEFVQK